MNVTLQMMTCMMLQDWVPQFIMYGDMGRQEGAFILPHFKLEVQSPENPAIFRLCLWFWFWGRKQWWCFHEQNTRPCSCCSLYDNRQQPWCSIYKLFQTWSIQTLLFRIPYNFSNYLSHFSMQRNGNKFWYSIDLGLMRSSNMYVIHRGLFR